MIVRAGGGRREAGGGRDGRERKEGERGEAIQFSLLSSLSQVVCTCNHSSKA